jgi:hypothetical protein
MGSATKSASACEAPEGVSNAVEAPTTSHRTQERKSWTLDALPAMGLVRRSEVSNILRGEKPRIDSIPLNSPISKLRPSRIDLTGISENTVQSSTVYGSPASSICGRRAGRASQDQKQVVSPELPLTTPSNRLK